MIKVYSLFIVFNCILFYCKAQKTITIDFNQKSEPVINFSIRKGNFSIRKGDYYRVIINHINNNLYKVSLSSIDTVLSKPQQTPTFGSLDLDALSKLVAGVSPLSTSVSVFPAMQNFSHQINLMNDKIVDLKNEQPRIKEPTIIDRMNKEMKQLMKSKSKIDAIVAKIDELKLKVNLVRLNALKLDNPALTGFDFSTVLTSIQQIRTDVANLQKDISDEKGSYDEFSEKKKDEISKNHKLTEGDKSIKESYNKFTTALTELQSSITADKAYELLSTVVLIENNKDNMFTSFPIQFLGEQAKVQLSIVPRDEKYNLQPYYTQIVFPTPIKTYTVVGVSFYGATLHDSAFSTIKTKVDTSSVYNIIAEKVNKGEIGVAALLRHGTKLNEKNNVGIHGSFGAGISISNKIKPRMLFGGGFTFGEKHMLAIDIGGIVGYVDRLSTAIDISKQFTEEPKTITVSKIGFGGFLSIGYSYQF